MSTIDVSGNIHRLIAAPTGGGKWYFVGSLAEELYRNEVPFIVLDTKTQNHIGLVGLKGVKRLQIKPYAEYDYTKLVKYPYILVNSDITHKNNGFDSGIFKTDRHFLYIGAERGDRR